MKRILLSIAGLLLLTSCAAVHDYEKVYVNADEMKLAPAQDERFEMNFQVYREGASGANSGKSGGGCGCN